MQSDLPPVAPWPFRSWAPPPRPTYRAPGADQRDLDRAAAKRARRTAKRLASRKQVAA